MRPQALLRSQNFPHTDPELAFEDSLTGAHNRRLLTHLFDHRWPELISAKVELALVVVDLDRFKTVNDSYGHLLGDKVLKVTAQALRQSFRQEDFIIRYGGDEFVIIAPGSDGATARARAQQARIALEGSRFEAPEAGEPIDVPVSFSVGVASFPSDGETGECLLGVADQRLYHEKRRRRSRNFVGKLAFALLAALVLLASAVVLLRGGREADVQVEAIVEGLLESAPLPAPKWAGAKEQQDAEIRKLKERQEAEIGRLRDEIRALRALAETRSARLPADYEREIRDLQTRIEELEAQQVEQGESPSNAIVTEIDGSERGRPASVPPVTKPDDGGEFQAEAVPPPVPPPPIETEAVGATVPTPPAPQPTEVVPPKLVDPPKAKYPEPARGIRPEGTVRLRLVVDAQGEVVEVDRLGPKVSTFLERAAREAAEGLRFEPGRLNGIPTKMPINLEVRFVRGSIELMEESGTRRRIAE